MNKLLMLGLLAIASCAEPPERTEEQKARIKAQLECAIDKRKCPCDAQHDCALTDPREVLRR